MLGGDYPASQGLSSPELNFLQLILQVSTYNNEDVLPVFTQPLLFPPQELLNTSPLVQGGALKLAAMLFSNSFPQFQGLEAGGD